MVFTRSRPSTRQRGAVEFTLLALGDWFPRLVDVGGTRQRRRLDCAPVDAPADRASA